MRVSHDPLTFEKHIIMLLKGMRRNKKITQSELANRIGVSRDTIARIESGKARVYMAQVVAIAKALDIALQDLVSVTMEETDLVTGEKNQQILLDPHPHPAAGSIFSMIGRAVTIHI